jgi:hypothetical protein
MIDAKVLSRSFTYNGVKLADPDPRMTPEDVELPTAIIIPSLPQPHHGTGSEWRTVGLQLRQSDPDERLAGMGAELRSANTN